MAVKAETVLIRDLGCVGSSVPRIDSMPKVTGSATYTRDVTFPRMLYGRVKRCPLPHARILSINLSGAATLPGVRAVITGKDFARMLGADTPALAYDEVLYSNQGVAAVAAEDRGIAEEALDKIEIDYEELPPVFDPEIAMSEGTPTLVMHPNELGKPPNVGAYFKVRKGNVEEAFLQADHIVENRYTTGMESHLQLEPLTFVVQPDIDGGVTIWSTSSGPHKTQFEVASYLGMDPHLIRVKVPFLGGWFGSKEESHVAAVCAMLAIKSRRNVKLELSREETMTATGVRHPSVIYVKDGVKRDGRIIARQIRALYNGGAYGSRGNWVLQGSILAAVGVYDIPNMKVDSYRVYTNLSPGTPKRGPMGVQMTWAVESQMDDIAARLGLDPLEVRRANLLREGDENAIGERMESISHEKCLFEVAQAIQWGKRIPSHGSWRGGKGVAVGVKWSYGGRFEAKVRVLESGKVEVWVDVVENGQGSYTSITQLVATEFGISPKDVILMPLIYGSDSATSGLAPGASGSRQLVNVGNAVLEACGDAKRRIAELATNKLGSNAGELGFRDGILFVKSNPNRSVRISDLFTKEAVLGGSRTVVSFTANELSGYGAIYKPQLGEVDPDTGRCIKGRVTPYYTNVAQAAEVSVNTETGEVKVHRVAAAMDVGKAINPGLVRAQIIGSVVMGLSAALGEELVISHGRIMNANLADYKITTATDAVTIEPIIIETPFKDGPHGAKGGGEASIIPTAAALRNAIADATGAWVNDLPITPEQVMESIERSKAFHQ